MLTNHKGLPYMLERAGLDVQQGKIQNTKRVPIQKHLELKLKYLFVVKYFCLDSNKIFIELFC